MEPPSARGPRCSERAFEVASYGAPPTSPERLGHTSILNTFTFRLTRPGPAPNIELNSFKYEREAPP
jgi:hypothetical protein